MKVVTRFAPSPTGYLHVGGARTALFNWLFARHHGGTYLLRIEDTDRARSTPEAVQAIFSGLDWLGLAADGQATFQFARAGRHREVAEAMVARGTAYRCYVTAEELDERRRAGAAAREALSALRKDPTASETERARLQGEVEMLTRAFRSPYRDGLRPPSPGAPYVVRVRAPDAGEIVNDDLVQGPVRWAARDLDDRVLLRSDGSPTYMLSVVVDDHDMGVTHIIRGDDHLTNTAVQIVIGQAMGWTPPPFAHLPMIHGPDGAKLSKRHGAEKIEQFRDMGYLPEAMLNYLARLGWSHGDDEIFSLAQAAEWFDIADVNRAPGRLDFDKLSSVNAHYMRIADDARLERILIEFINTQRPDWRLTPETRARVRAGVPILKQRAKTVAELADQSFFLIRARPYTLDGPAQKAMKDEAKALLRRLLTRLDAASSWDVESLGALIKGFAQDEGVGLGQFGPALRAALTGGGASPELAQTISLLGRDEAIARLRDFV
jgi:glutamyl-tRNA synthetase